jgi:hypothetical protein
MHDANNRDIHDIVRTVYCKTRPTIQLLFSSPIRDPVEKRANEIDVNLYVKCQGNYLNAFHDGFGEWFFPVLLPSSMCNIIVEFINGKTAKETVRFTCELLNCMDFSNCSIEIEIDSFL